jgi:hypothetical protein
MTRTFRFLLARSLAGTAAVKVAMESHLPQINEGDNKDSHDGDTKVNGPQSPPPESETMHVVKEQDQSGENTQKSDMDQMVKIIALLKTALKTSLKLLI